MKTRIPRLLLLAAALLPLAAHGAEQRRPLDRGGVSLLLEVKAEAPRADRIVERTAAVIRKRCARLGIRCGLRRPAGGATNRLLLHYSTATDEARVRSILLAPGFELRRVASPPNPFPLWHYRTRAEAEAEAGPAAGSEVIPLERGEGEATYIVVARAPIITGDDVRRAVAIRAISEGGSGEYEVECRLSPRGGARLRAWTRANINQYVAVVYGGRALSAPYIRAPIWYDVVISGGFDRERAKDVAVVLGGGNLPAPVEVVEEGTYKP